MDKDKKNSGDVHMANVDMTDAKTSTVGAFSRHSDGGIYLVVADETEEFNVALRYAVCMAQSNRGHVGILHVIRVEDFQHWGSIESRMKRELRDTAEKFIWSMAKRANDLNGMIPVLYVYEGESTHDVITNLINEDMTIKMLVLGASTSSSSGPGPTVSYFTGKGLGKIRVPIVLVPEHIES